MHLFITYVTQHSPSYNFLSVWKERTEGREWGKRGKDLEKLTFPIKYFNTSPETNLNLENIVGGKWLFFFSVQAKICLIFSEVKALKESHRK